MFNNVGKRQEHLAPMVAFSGCLVLYRSTTRVILTRRDIGFIEFLSESSCDPFFHFSSASSPEEGLMNGYLGSGVLAAGGTPEYVLCVNGFSVPHRNGTCSVRTHRCMNGDQNLLQPRKTGPTSGKVITS